MTTLAAIELEDGAILIGSDSFQGSLHELSPDIGQQASISKWARWPGGWAIGVAGHLRVLQEIAACRAGAEDFPVGQVIKNLQGLLVPLCGLEPETEGGFRLYGAGCTFLLARPGNGVFILDGQLGAQQINAGKFCASGTGREFAYGAFEAIGGNRDGVTNLERTQQFTEALSAAIRLDESSGPPLKIEILELPQRTIKSAAHEGTVSRREAEAALAALAGPRVKKAS